MDFLSDKVLVLSFSFLISIISISLDAFYKSSWRVFSFSVLF